MIMRIKELRKEANITQVQLAESLGVMQSVISNWENETYLPKVRQLPTLASVLGVSISELFVPTSSISQSQAEVHAS